MVTRQQIVDKAREALGTRWRSQGRSLHEGLDCSGLTVWIAHQLGLFEYDYKNYSRDTSTWGDMFEHYGAAGCTRIMKNKAKAGSILIFPSSIYPVHCAILAGTEGELTLISGNASAKKVIEERYDPLHNAAPRAAFDYPGVID